MIYLGIYLSLCGIWPFADPGHEVGSSPLVTLDLLLHIFGLYLILRSADWSGLFGK